MAKAKTKSSKPQKTETLAEYLARGGVINRIPVVVQEPTPDVVKKSGSSSGASVFLSMDDADLYYGEVRKTLKAKKPKSSLKIDLNALPPALRTKFITKLKEEAGGEEYQEDL